VTREIEQAGLAGNGMDGKGGIYSGGPGGKDRKEANNVNGKKDGKDWRGGKHWRDRKDGRVEKNGKGGKNGDGRKDGSSGKDGRRRKDGKDTDDSVTLRFSWSHNVAKPFGITSPHSCPKCKTFKPWKGSVRPSEDPVTKVAKIQLECHHCQLKVNYLKRDSLTKHTPGPMTNDSRGDWFREEVNVAKPSVVF
jgi:hypothetical protein